MEVPKPNPKPLRLFYFWAGIIATVAYRIIIVLNFYDPFWVKVCWYIGTVGFILYFIHRYDISSKRAKLIVKYQLREKVRNQDHLYEQDLKALDYILRTLVSTKEKWNYIFIFAMSGLALVVGLYLDLFA